MLTADHQNLQEGLQKEGRPPSRGERLRLVPYRSLLVQFEYGAINLETNEIFQNQLGAHPPCLASPSLRNTNAWDLICVHMESTDEHSTSVMHALCIFERSVTWLRYMAACAVAVVAIAICRRGGPEEGRRERRRRPPRTIVLAHSVLALPKAAGRSEWCV
eukprot:COSAG06_NODE_4799_length_3945_cov_8.420376_5_plen_161_part_00